MKKKSNTIAKMFAVIMIAMILLPVLLSTGQAVVGYVDKEIFQPWAREKDEVYQQAKSNVTELLNQYQ